MEQVFLFVLNNAITVSALIIAIIMVRALGKKMPKWITCMLWIIVAFRLIVPIQIESAYSLGLDNKQTFLYVVFPQALSISMPAFMANVIFLLKETSVFSAISLMDLMFTAKDLIGLYYQTTESLFLLVLFYLLILLPVSLVGSLLEKRLRYAGFGT